MRVGFLVGSGYGTHSGFTIVPLGDQRCGKTGYTLRQPVPSVACMVAIVCACALVPVVRSLAFCVVVGHGFFSWEAQTTHHTVGCYIG